MWKRNLLFVGLCLFGLSSVAANLLSRNHVHEPKQFDPQRLERDEYREIVGRVNREFHEHWQQAEVQPAPPVDALTIARRLSLGLTGTIPSFEEICALEKKPAGERVEWWLSRLLEDRRYADYLAERLARAYVGTENGPFLVYRRRRFVLWLSEQLQKNTPYDGIVRELINSKGLWTDSPPVNFVTATFRENGGGKPDPIRLAGRTTRAFLGMRIDCLQCHDDKLGNTVLGTPDEQRAGKQTDFHQLAAFYTGAQAKLNGVREYPINYKYKYLNAEEETAVPAAVPFQPELGDQDAAGRERLAQWVTHRDNKPFARAIVNRIWALMFGKPLVTPIDDIPLYADEYPPGLETLAQDFVQHDYDLRRLIRVIAASDVFQRSSEAEEFEITPKHERNWAVFPLTRLRPEQMAGAMIQSASLKTIDASAHVIFRIQRYNEQNEFIKRYGDMGDDEFIDRGGTITQRLLMMNGDLIHEKIKGDLALAARRIAILSPTNEKALEATYLALLTRRPTDDERAHFLARLTEAGRERTPCLQDLYWVLLNSTEFSWDH